MAAYSFRTVVREDLPLLRRWLVTPEVVRWWGNPVDQEALLEEDIDYCLMAMQLVLLDGRPFAYAQHYNVHSWPQAHLADLPPGPRAIDSFIGDPEMIGKGHGAAFLRMLAERLRADGAPVVAVDPSAENLRARRAYAKAGFREQRPAETPDGTVVLMTFVG